MKKEIKLIIPTRLLLDKVADMAEYAAVKLGIPENYAKISITEGDESLLLTFARQAMAALEERFRFNYPSTSITDTEISVTLETGEAFSDTFEHPRNSDLDNYLAYSILASWFAFSNKEESPAYATQAGAYLESMRNKFLTKQKPERP